MNVLVNYRTLYVSTYSVINQQQSTNKMNNQHGVISWLNLPMVECTVVEFIVDYT